MSVVHSQYNAQFPKPAPNIFHAPIAHCPGCGVYALLPEGGPCMKCQGLNAGPTVYALLLAKLDQC